MTDYKNTLHLPTTEFAMKANLPTREPERLKHWEDTQLDEAYYPYYRGSDTLSWIQEHPNLVCLRTFSKIYGLAGLRIGFAVAHPEVIALLERAQLPFTINQAAMWAALAALDDQAFLDKSLQNNVAGMRQLQQGFEALHLAPLPSVANFITLDLKQAALPIYEKLLHHGIIVRPLHAYGLDQHLRITIGTPEQNQRLLTALAACLRGNT